MREFIDKTSEQSGTPLNRDYLMAIQGFDAIETSINMYGYPGPTIVETNACGETLTTVFYEGQISEFLVGSKRIEKNTMFDENGNISEVIS